jgi:hypothetical protein
MFRATIINKVSGCKIPDTLKSGSIATNDLALPKFWAVFKEWRKAKAVGLTDVSAPSLLSLKNKHKSSAKIYSQNCGNAPERRSLAAN